ncbi:MAG: glycosyltransferase family 2 protein [Chitinophagaceae bacterium]|nr:glycosyltransferase family 2 protein [Chitinophagaceae bacterium]
MPPKPFISVVIPCYNSGAYLPETISRLRQQTYSHFEIIVVNDGSTDVQTIELLEGLSKQGITVLHKANGRMSSARNFGVQHAKGTVIAALDADDYFDSSFFEKAIAVLSEKTEVAVVTSHIQLFGNYREVARPRGGNAFNFLFSSECPACAIVRKDCWDAIGGYDENMKMGYEDWEFYIRITQKGWLVEVIPEKLLFYRQTNNSTHKNDTIPHRQELVNYIIDKHHDWYLECLKKLVAEKQVLYTESRIALPTIFKMFMNRLRKKYR